MTAEELKKRFSMGAHEENGSFAECHYESREPGRPASGSIYYYVAPGEVTAFHVIDCDEYWCYTAGDTLEIWQFDEDGTLTKHLLGIEGEAVPLVYLRKGTYFASRHREPGEEGTFLTCITVPRFTYEGFRMLSEAEMREKFPLSEGFYTGGPDKD